MLRFFAGAAACFLLMTGAFLIWQSRAQDRPLLPSAPQARSYGESMIAQTPLEAPEASPQSREQKRFSRYDKNKDGKVEADEYLAARRRNFDKLDVDHNGSLSFEEYAAKGIEKSTRPAAARDGFRRPNSSRQPRRPPSARPAAAAAPRPWRLRTITTVSIPPHRQMGRGTMEHGGGVDAATPGEE